MKIRNHPYFGLLPYGTAAFLKERKNTKDVLLQIISWLVVGTANGFVSLILMYGYREAGLKIPLELYLQASVAIFIVAVYLPYLVQSFQKLKSLTKEYFQYLESFRERFGSI